ncbi:hypothetical protein TNCV_4112931 [Trichonephila clavipes]|nr:hypothetical protein TNCV_4112931 [Trichonephila clavipes]
MEVDVACGAATAWRRMRRSSRADVTLAAPGPLESATFPCANHLHQRRCTVDTSRLVSAARFDETTNLPFSARSPYPS